MTPTPHRTRLLAAAATGALATALPIVGTTPAQATNPGIDDAVVYTALFGTTAGIAVTDTAGTSTHLLTPRVGNVAQPSVSPDGRHIAFVRDGDVVVMNTDGRDKHVVVHDAGDTAATPSYSPDGSHLLYALWDGHRTQIWSARADGTHRRRISRGSSSEYSPVWAPSGTQIAFVRESSGIRQVFVMDAGGSDVTPVTSDPYGAGDPAYAPDGDLVYEASDGYSGHIFASTASGTEQLTFGSGSDESPVVSPSGDKIAFARYESGAFHVWTMNVDGTDQQQLVGDDSAEPAWAPEPVRCHGRWATIVGTAGSDDLRGSPGHDVIVGRGGNDRIDGGWGNDVICGGGGADTVHGDLGADHVYGGSGADQLYGDPGPDVLHGDAGADLVVGGVGPDRLFGESGSDVLGALDHQHDQRIDCGPGHDHARWDHHHDPHPHSC